MTRSPRVRASNRAGYLVTSLARGHAVLSDQPVSAGGSDMGVTPTEQVLAALAACTAITLRMYAERKGWALGTVRVEAELQDGSDGRRIVRQVDLDAELDPPALARLVEIAERTPVTRLLASGTTIVTRLGQDRVPAGAVGAP